MMALLYLHVQVKLELKFSILIGFKQWGYISKKIDRMNETFKYLAYARSSRSSVLVQF